MYTEELDVFTESRLPLQERVVDKLADIMFASDMIIDMLNDQRFEKAQQLETVVPAVKRIYDEVNGLMRKLTD
ncbi:MAG TPA: hypothetical protein VJZ76_14470 [Thermoanaerobaculia bacterium]|jgi:hypothetical protein|nr:hypothetical protein [Thermoanaerobaculia bacterium]